MLEMGILDPTKVTRSALQNAASVSGLMITTECMVAEMPSEDGGAAAAFIKGAKMSSADSSAIALVSGVSIPQGANAGSVDDTGGAVGIPDGRTW